MEQMTAEDELNVEEAVSELHTWIHTTGVQLKKQHDVFAEFCLVLQKVGLPVDRFYCTAQVMQPLVAARSWKWMDGRVTDNSWSRATNASFLDSISERSQHSSLPEPLRT